jgi:hypothetical protein
MKNEEEVRKMAEDHWEFIERWLHMVYVDTFIHGYGHGVEDASGKIK